VAMSCMVYNTADLPVCAMSVQHNRHFSRLPLMMESYNSVIH
jgi:hypothetical protein